MGSSILETLILLLILLLLGSALIPLVPPPARASGGLKRLVLLISEGALVRLVELSLLRWLPTSANQLFIPVLQAACRGYLALVSLGIEILEIKDYYEAFFG